jgi:hypothetical protein
MNRPNKNDFLTSNQYTYSEEINKYYDALEKYADYLTSLKVAEATLPNVKDWDEVYKKFKENYKNSEHILHPINFLSWLKQHYSTPLSASEHRTITKVLDLFEAIRDCSDEDWKHNRIRMSEILKELQISPSEQTPLKELSDITDWDVINDGFIGHCRSNKLAGSYADLITYLKQNYLLPKSERK